MTNTTTSKPAIKARIEFLNNEIDWWALEATAGYDHDIRAKARNAVRKLKEERDELETKLDREFPEVKGPALKGHNSTP